MAERVILKKYANRRLYDTEKSAYITLGEVADLIKGGREVQVVDAQTKEDVTAFILTQVIAEEGKRKNTLLPASLLHLIIRFGENVLAEFFQNYLELSIRNYLVYKKTFDEQFRKWLEMGADFTELTQRSVAPFPSMDAFLDLFNPSKKPKDQ